MAIYQVLGVNLNYRPDTQIHLFYCAAESLAEAEERAKVQCVINQAYGRTEIRQVNLFSENQVVDSLNGR
jgi:hypothetical protein